MKPRHPVQRLAGRQRVRLPIVHHLNAMLDRAQQGIGSGERSSLVGADPARPGKCRQCIARRRCPQRRVAPAVDQLMDLREELGLANTAPPPLQVVAGAEALTTRIMVANAPRQVADFADRAEVQPAPPHERPDRIEEIAAERLITSRYPGPDERRPLPCQRLTFIIADRPFDRQRDRRRFGRWAQPQIDTQHIAIAIARLQQLDDTLGDPHRRLFRLLTGAVRQRFRVEQQDRIDVGRIVKLATALLAQRDRDEAARLLPRGTLRNRGTDRAIERCVGEICQGVCDRGEIERPGKIADRHRQRQRPPIQPQLPCDWHIRMGAGESQVDLPRRQSLRQHRLTVEQQRQEGRMYSRTLDGIGKIGAKTGGHRVTSFANDRFRSHATIRVSGRWNDYERQCASRREKPSGRLCRPAPALDRRTRPQPARRVRQLRHAR
ncbi:hypothetical protein WR25_00345 [Diploscapter pachys]|uniref:Uncharacterized protein n=1 Tax=Diploscapter pachys TaxID=2018661 RepID=A0A2A2K3N5_9BILA|nr:hypothetical protein WR25_00345 [Diploscapter pachys]